MQTLLTASDLDPFVGSNTFGAVFDINMPAATATLVQGIGQRMIVLKRILSET